MISLYVCGPTVYDHSHLGHARVYVVLDVIRRVLRRQSAVKYVMNVTDVDDKIILKAKETCTTPEKVADEHLWSFVRDMKRLGVEAPDALVKVTDVIPDIVSCVSNIAAKGFAYAREGSVYFDAKKFREMHPNVPEIVEEDFVLWKGKRPAGEPVWPSPFGKGRPGWHIECTAIANLHFGDRLSFHGGGCDLKFPHHNNSSLQSYAMNGTDKWCDKFLHVGHLHIEGRKMSKSLKNFISIDDMLQRYTATQLRLLFLTHDWRTFMEFSEETSMQTVLQLDAKLKSFVAFTVDDWQMSQGCGGSQDLHEHILYLGNVQAAIKKSLLAFDFHITIETLLRAVRYSRGNDAVGMFRPLVMETLSILGLQYCTGAEIALSELKRLRTQVRCIAKEQNDAALYRVTDDCRQRLKDASVCIED